MSIRGRRHRTVRGGNIHPWILGECPHCSTGYVGLDPSIARLEGKSLTGQIGDSQRLTGGASLTRFRGRVTLELFIVSTLQQIMASA